MRSIKIWVSAFRLRTLPLATASIILGSFLAAAENLFSIKVAGFCFLTATLLQILSNLANDYGDSVHGADNSSRQGPSRAVQSGQISKRSMQIALSVFVGLCLLAGYILIRGESWFYYLLGIAAIGAAVAYTMGPKPYGYAGLGDIFVLTFFGIVGVCGTYYLHTHSLNYMILLPAFACGLFCVAVLNINNIRDITSDASAGKITLPVRLGEKKARIYHWILLLGGTALALLYIVLNYKTPWQFLFLVTLPLIVKNGLSVSQKFGAVEIDPYLKQMAITTLIFCFSFGLGIVL